MQGYCARPLHYALASRPHRQFQCQWVSFLLALLLLASHWPLIALLAPSALPTPPHRHHCSQTGRALALASPPGCWITRTHPLAATGASCPSSLPSSRLPRVPAAASALERRPQASPRSSTKALPLPLSLCLCLRLCLLDAPLAAQYEPAQDQVALVMGCPLPAALREGQRQCQPRPQVRKEPPSARGSRRAWAPV